MIDIMLLACLASASDFDFKDLQRAAAEMTAARASSPFLSPRARACRKEVSCFSALDGTERKLCQAYVEGQSCFMALDGADVGWCKRLKEGSSCFMALDGAAQEACKQGRYPGEHIYWMRCARIPLPKPEEPGSPRLRACRGEVSCFSALDGVERGLCQAYVEGKSCFMSLDGADRGWCQVLKEGSSCFQALDGREREACERDRYPGEHMFWRSCKGKR